MNRFTYFLVLASTMLLPVCLAPSADAMPVTQLDFTEGSVRHGGRFDWILDRLLGQDGVLKMGEYQPIGDIVPSITKGHSTFSLFTSGLNGAPAPSASVDGSSITADLSSLFFAVSLGDSIKLWNIGSLATGTFDPETSQFSLSWKDRVPGSFDGRHSDFSRSSRHYFEDKWESERSHWSKRSYGWDGKGDWYGNDKYQGKDKHRGDSQLAAFSLEGTAVVVAIPASLVLYTSGLFGLGTLVWWRKRQIVARRTSPGACRAVEGLPV
jgi:hypothetical protein